MPEIGKSCHDECPMVLQEFHRLVMMASLGPISDHLIAWMHLKTDERPFNPYIQNAALVLCDQVISATDAHRATLIGIQVSPGRAEEDVRTTARIYARTLKADMPCGADIRSLKGLLARLIRTVLYIQQVINVLRSMTIKDHYFRSGGNGNIFKIQLPRFRQFLRGATEQQLMVVKLCYFDKKRRHSTPLWEMYDQHELYHSLLLHYNLPQQIALDKHQPDLRQRFVLETDCGMQLADSISDALLTVSFSELADHGDLVDFAASAVLTRPYSDYFHQIAWSLFHALEYLHDALKLAHLDVKVGNVFVFSRSMSANEKHYEFKLADFGLSTKIPVNRPFAARHSPEYGPEAYSPGNQTGVSRSNVFGINAKTDYFGFGMLLLDLLGLNCHQVLATVAPCPNPREKQSQFVEDMLSKIDLETSWHGYVANDQSWKAIVKDLIAIDPERRSTRLLKAKLDAIFPSLTL